MTPNDVISRAARILNDEERVRWKDAELLDYVGDGQRQIVHYKPESNSTDGLWQVVAGETRQVAPADSMRVLRVTRSLRGGQPLRAISITSRAVLDSMDRDWHSRQGDVVQLWLYEPDVDKGVFFIYPAVPQGAALQVEYSRRPDDPASMSSNLEIGDQWLDALVDWVLYRAFSKDADYGGNAQRAAGYGQAFAGRIGLKWQTDQMADPNMRRRGGETRGQV